MIDTSHIQRDDNKEKEKEKEIVDMCIKFIQMKRPNAFNPKANFYNAILEYSKSV